jgi:hypothetical protein
MLIVSKMTILSGEFLLDFRDKIAEFVWVSREFGEYGNSIM